jgi:hypothetical protein
MAKKKLEQSPGQPKEQRLSLELLMDLSPSGMLSKAKPYVPILSSRSPQGF